MKYNIVVELKDWEISIENEIDLIFRVYLKFNRIPFIKFNLLKPVLMGAWDCACIPTGQGTLNSKIKKILKLIYGAKIPVDHCFSKIGDQQLDSLDFEHNLTVLGDGTIKISIPLNKLSEDERKGIKSKELFCKIAAHLGQFFENWFKQGISCIESSQN
jgi:hypothetical protein